MKKFYFTYGSEGHPFVGGWTEVEAQNFTAACNVFMAVHPNDDGDCLKCASIYTDKDFPAKIMENGNFGEKCHEKITLTVEELNE